MLIPTELVTPLPVVSRTLGEYVWVSSELFRQDIMVSQVKPMRCCYLGIDRGVGGLFSTAEVVDRGAGRLDQGRAGHLRACTQCTQCSDGTTSALFGQTLVGQSRNLRGKRGDYKTPTKPMRYNHICQLSSTEKGHLSARAVRAHKKYQCSR